MIYGLARANFTKYYEKAPYTVLPTYALKLKYLFQFFYSH